jgi:UDP-N-acetylmuramate dehydrogenase
MEILDNFNLKNFNTFHVSAYARYFINVTDITNLKEALAFADAKELPFMLIGQGSNLLFREDFPGVILEMNIHGKKIVEEDGDNVLVKARCGENWHAFVQWCLDKKCYGLENLSLIPGNIGAAPVQNIGAYGVELCDVMESLEAVEIATGELKTFSNEDCRFSYRSSVFKEEFKDQYVIYNVSFRLSRKAKVKIDYASLAIALEKLPVEEVTPELVSKIVCDIRRSKLPNPGRLGNAGSFFWNPVISAEEFSRLQKNYPDIVAYPNGDKVKLAAAWLIEQAGWKGFREGDVGVHQDHALVLVNYGQGTGAQLVTLSEQIQVSVQDKFGIALTPEVRII